LVGVAKAKANAKAKAVAAWSNAEAGAKAEARSETKGERDRGPRITGEESSGRRHGGSSGLSASRPRVTRLCRGEGNGASLPSRERTRRRSKRARGRDENREANARDHGSHGARNARPRQTERRSEAAYRAGSWEAESRRPRARRASNDRTTDRPADTPPRIGHRAIFIKSFLLQAATRPLSSALSPFLSASLPPPRLPPAL
jgi:hypothetical protein